MNHEYFMGEALALAFFHAGGLLCAGADIIRPCNSTRLSKFSQPLAPERKP